MLRKLVGSLNLGFRRYVVCRKCHQIYTFSQCVHNTSQTSKKCPYKRFPDHPHARLRQSCDTLLLKTVELASGKIIHYPFMTYCYMSLELSLGNLL